MINHEQPVNVVYVEGDGFRPQRKCFNKDGSRKHAFRSFDEAQEMCFSVSSGNKRLAAYPCDEHGWHVGTKHDTAA